MKIGQPGDNRIDFKDHFKVRCPTKSKLWLARSGHWYHTSPRLIARRTALQGYTLVSGMSHLERRVLVICYARYLQPTLAGAEQ